MYNDEIKKRYIEYKEAATIMCQNYLERVFNAVEPFEEQLGKDVGDFTANEIIDYYKYLNKSSVDAIAALNSTLSLYTQWYIGELLSIDHQNHFSELTRTIFISCVNKRKMESSIITRKDLLKNIRDLRNLCDSFILLALFEGISGKNYSEIRSLRYRDFDGDYVTLCNGRKIKASYELNELARETSDEQYYYMPFQDKERAFKFQEPEGDDLIIKSHPNAKNYISDRQKAKRIYGKIKRSLDYIGYPWMTGNDIIESGKIHFIKTRCEELGISGYEYLFSDHINEVNKQFGCNIVRSNYYSKYKEYLP